MTDLKPCGTYAAWCRGCRCDQCALAEYRYKKRWRYENAQGMRRFVDAQPARAHIDMLVMQGMTLRSIGSAAHIAASAVISLYNGQQPYAHRVTVEKLMRVTGPLSVERDPTDLTLVPRLGAVRRIQAMQVMGYSHHQMRDLSGVRTSLILSQPGGWITWRNHYLIREMCRQHGLTPGTSVRARTSALTKGWVSLMAWDDIDDPNETPNTTGPTPNPEADDLEDAA